MRNRKKVIIAYALIDSCDSHLAEFRWCRDSSTGYVRRGTKRNGVQKSYYLHREVMQAPTGIEVDHEDGNLLDNRRSNLRCVTHAQQLQNQKTHVKVSSKYRGVSYDKARNKWSAEVNLAGKRYRLGRFSSEEAAGRAARRCREKVMTHANEER